MRRKDDTCEGVKQQENGRPRAPDSILILPAPHTAPLPLASSRLQSPGPLGAALAMLMLSLRGTDEGVWPPVNRGQVCREELILGV